MSMKRGEDGERIGRGLVDDDWRLINQLGESPFLYPGRDSVKAVSSPDPLSCLLFRPLYHPLSRPLSPPAGPSPTSWPWPCGTVSSSGTPARVRRIAGLIFPLSLSLTFSLFPSRTCSSTHRRWPLFLLEGRQGPGDSPDRFVFTLRHTWTQTQSSPPLSHTQTHTHTGATQKLLELPQADGAQTNIVTSLAWGDQPGCHTLAVGTHTAEVQVWPAKNLHAVQSHACTCASRSLAHSPPAPPHLFSLSSPVPFPLSVSPSLSHTNSLPGPPLSPPLSLPHAHNPPTRTRSCGM
jgi:hypothetical protein